MENIPVTGTGIRINKYLSKAGVCSRREADRLLASGRVCINGIPATAGIKVLNGQKVTVDGRPVPQEEEEIFIAFYKPAGIVCTTASSENGSKITNVVDYIGYNKRIYPAGRLDQESEGLLLMTNQGDIMEKILRNRYGHEKEYFVKVDHKITDDFIINMGKGVPIKGTITKPCKIWKENDYSFHIILTQGLNRQIRRMCGYFGYSVVYLRRDRIMNITLDGLEKGKYRHLAREEVKELKLLCQVDKLENNSMED